MELSKKQKNFLDFLLQFWNLDQMLNILKKYKTLIAYVSPNVRTTKSMVKKISKKSCFTRPFQEQPGQQSQKRPKSAPQHFYYN